MSSTNPLDTASAGILGRILEHKRAELNERRAALPLAELRAEIDREDAPVRGFEAAIRRDVAAGRPAIVAELKRASPSRGPIRQDYRPAELARSYLAARASCLSVLTDARFFQGDLEHLREAHAAVKLPVLRKDFLIDPYQVYEARAAGADCILLIVAILDDAQLRDLKDLAVELGMDVLVEIHDREELTRALMLQTGLIGINNRNLHTFETDIATTLGLLTDVPADRIVVSESGIHSAEQVATLRSRGVHAFLVGEACMAAPDPGTELRQLFAPSPQR